MMKLRNRVIICLAVIGLILFSFVQGIVIPQNNHKRQQYISDQQNPSTHDLSSILKYKSKYMGDACNDINLFYALPLNNIPRTYEMFSDKLTIQINFKSSSKSIGQEKLNKALIYNSTAAFALVDNLEIINYNFTDKKIIIMRSSISKLYNVKLSNLLNKSEWKSKVQDKLEDKSYVNNIIITIEK